MMLKIHKGIKEHIYSKYSYDSLTDPKTIVKVAKRVKLNAIAITDHNTIVGGIITRRVCKEKLIIVVVGSEISTNLGDVIGLFLNEQIKSGNIYDVIDEIKLQDGLILIPLPFKGKSLLQNIDLIGCIDLLEGYNSRHPVTSQQLSILKTMNKPLVAGSDAHFPQEIGLSLTILSRTSIAIYQWFEM